MGRRCGRSNPWQPGCPHMALAAGGGKAVWHLFHPQQEANSKTTASATQLAWLHTGMMGTLKETKRGQDLPHANQRKDTWAKRQRTSWLTSRSYTYSLITNILKIHISTHRCAQPRLCSLVTTAGEYQHRRFLPSWGAEETACRQLS